MLEKRRKWNEAFYMTSLTALLCFGLGYGPQNIITHLGWFPPKITLNFFFLSCVNFFPHICAFKVLLLCNCSVFLILKFYLMKHSTCLYAGKKIEMKQSFIHVKTLCLFCIECILQRAGLRLTRHSQPFGACANLCYIKLFYFSSDFSHIYVFQDLLLCNCSAFLILKLSLMKHSTCLYIGKSIETKQSFIHDYLARLLPFWVD